MSEEERLEMIEVLMKLLLDVPEHKEYKRDKTKCPHCGQEITKKNE